VNAEELAARGHELAGKRRENVSARGLGSGGAKGAPPDPDPHFTALVPTASC
jgi:hypothetical protein